MYIGVALGITGASPVIALGTVPLGVNRQDNKSKVYDTPSEKKEGTPICDIVEENLTYQYLIETDPYAGIGKLVRTYLDTKHNSRCTVEYLIDKKLPKGTGYITIFKKPTITYGIHSR